MEMIEGASLQDHFNALSERHDTLSEDRIWHIFVQVRQVCLKRSRVDELKIAEECGNARQEKENGRNKGLGPYRDERGEEEEAYQDRA